MSVMDDVNRTVDEATEKLGTIDVLVTCAGSSPGGLLEELTEDDWLQSLNLKFMGYVRTCRAVIATRQPSWASRRATSRPMPMLPPVTNATLPCSPRSI